jgi:hypothetical protein
MDTSKEEKAKQTKYKSKAIYIRLIIKYIY